MLRNPVRLYKTKMINRSMLLKRGFLLCLIILVSGVGVGVLLISRPAPTSPATLHVCPAEIVAQLQSALPPYSPTDIAPYITLRDGQFYAGDQPYFARGVNYYPARFPWRRFLSAEMSEVERELDLLQGAGFNTLRVFLWYEALFQCENEGAVPEAQGFLRFEAVLHAAAARGFRLIVTLNDMPDLINHPLYNNPAYNREQTAFILRRYRDEAAVLAWDLRNEGDIDYSEDRGSFEREQVLNWLGNTANLAREIAPNHLITAGWLNDAFSTAPYVDFISFHHWWDATRLRERIAEIRANTDLPVLLEEVGYSTFERSQDAQRDLLASARQTAEREGLLGWLVWAAFDFPLDATCFPPPCTSPNNQEHYFGVWTVDYEPKSGLSALLP